MQTLTTFLFHNTSLRQTVAKNTFWLFFGHALTRLLKFFLVIFAARILGAAGYGSFSFALSFTALLFLFADFGVRELLIREYAKNIIEKRSLIANCLYIKVFLLVISAIVAISAIPFVHDSAARGILVFIILFYVTDALRDFFVAIARAMQRMELEALIIVAESIATTAIGITALVYAPGLLSLSLAYLGGALLSLALVIVLLSWLVSNIFARPNIALIKKILSLGWPFAFGAAIGFILMSTDTVMLGLLKTPEVVGHFSVGSKVVQLLLIVPTVLAIVILPVLSGLHSDRNQLSVVVQKATSFLGMLAVPFVVGGIITAPRLLPAMFGDQYRPGVLPFQILLFVIPFFFLVIIWDYLLLAVNLQVRDMQYTAIAAALNVVLNLLLIPRFGIIGAASATLLAQSLNLVLTFFLVKKFLTKAPLRFSAMVPYLVAVLAMVLFLLLPFTAAIPLFALIPLAAAIYFFTLSRLRVPILQDIAGLLR